MRSDREEIPEPFTKADADKAETMEARISLSRLTAGCQVYWPSPYEVCGAIKDKYNSLGGPSSFLLWPTSAELTNPNNSGKRTQFLNGPIYWSVAGGAHPVVNSILNRWGVHQYESGWLKYPISDEILLPDGGRRQEFETGAIYVAFQNAVGSAIKNGPIRDKWNAVGGNAPGGSLLGYVTGDEIPLPDGQGRMARFQNGVIYWSPTTGAHIVRGAILDLWEAEDFESGGWGYPLADEIVGPNDELTQAFEGGPIGIRKLFTREFKWEEAQTGALKICIFEGYTDLPHISHAKTNGVKLKDTASVHAYWMPLLNCPEGTRANITVQFQTKSPDGSWVDRGTPGWKGNVYPGTKSVNRAEANSKCQGFGKKTWRGKVDVDIIGWADDPIQNYGYEEEIECS